MALSFGLHIALGLRSRTCRLALAAGRLAVAWRAFIHRALVGGVAACRRPTPSGGLTGGLRRLCACRLCCSPAFMAGATFSAGAFCWAAGAGRALRPASCACADATPAVSSSVAATVDNNLAFVICRLLWKPHETRLVASRPERRGAASSSIVACNCCSSAPLRSGFRQGTLPKSIGEGRWRFCRRQSTRARLNFAPTPKRCARWSRIAGAARARRPWAVRKSRASVMSAAASCCRATA